MKVRDTRRKVAFLDTNALHYMRNYLDYCRKKKLSSDLSDDVDRSAMEAHLDAMTDKALRSSIRNGLKIIAWLVSKDLQVEYSPISELELISGLARGRALLSAAAEGIPDRRWYSFSEDDIWSRVTAEDLESIGGKVKEMSDELDEIGILKRSSDDTRDVLELARSLAEVVYLSPCDGIIYASALYVRAEYLITRDSYFKDMVNKIWNSEKPRFHEVRRQVQEIVDRVSLEGSPVQLPSAVWPAK